MGEAIDLAPFHPVEGALPGERAVRFEAVVEAKAAAAGLPVVGAGGRLGVDAKMGALV